MRSMPCRLATACMASWSSALAGAVGATAHPWSLRAAGFPEKKRRKKLLKRRRAAARSAHQEATHVRKSCSEEIVVPIDISAGTHQDDVEDCPRCRTTRGGPCLPGLSRRHLPLSRGSAARYRPPPWHGIRHAPDTEGCTYASRLFHVADARLIGIRQCG